jgi:hypothetical protein
VITDALLAVASTIAGWIAALLPSGHLTIPGSGPLVTVLGQLDSLVPIAGPLTAGVGVLAAVLAFVVVRLVLVLWNLIWP